MGGSRGLKLGIGVLACAGSLCGAGPATAAVTIGSDLPPPPPVPFAVSGCDPSCTVGTAQHPAAPAASPIDGVIVRWRMRFGEAFSGARLRVVASAFPIVGDSTITGIRSGPPTEVAAGLQEFPVNPGLPISAGNQIGIDISGDTDPTMFRSRPPADSFFEAPAIGDGATDSPTGALNDTEVLMNADVEADCDADGLGDETQDPDISACTPDTAGPETTITAGPKEKLKTRKKRAMVSFEFTSSEPGSSFECSLDGGPFEPCASPLTERIKAKRKAKQHVFGVRATDAAGNADSTPATDDFKLKRKRRR